MEGSTNTVGVVLAAGSGARFGSFKQFEMLHGERLVDRAVRLVTAAVGSAVVTLPDGVVWDGPPVVAAVAGGGSRLESLSAAVAAVPDGTTTILVHDPARPLATLAVCHDVVEAVVGGVDAAIATWPTPDTVKQVRADGSLKHLGRDGLLVAQSPMAYRLSELSRALEHMADNPDSVEAVEETVAMEHLGATVVAVPGDPWSHHIVEPRDLELAHRLVVDRRFAH